MTNWQSEEETSIIETHIWDMKHTQISMKLIYFSHTLFIFYIYGFKKKETEKQNGNFNAV